MKAIQSVVLFMCLLSTATCVNGDYIFSIRLLSFTNPSERLAAGQLCCEIEENLNTSTCPNPCNTTLQICVRDAEHSLDDFRCSVENLVVAAHQLPMELNPISSGPWPGSVQLYISAIHDVTGILGPQSPNTPVIGELIDDLLLNISLSPNSISATEMEVIGTFNRTLLRLSFEVICTFDFYGPECNNFCEGSRNDTFGHLTCDPDDGSIVCLRGYRNLTSNCSECIPLEGCSPEGGFCNLPGECVCREGYSGPLCATFGPPPTSGTCSTTPQLATTRLQPSPTLASSLRTSHIVMAEGSPSSAAVFSDVSILRDVRMTTARQQVVTPTVTPKVAFVQPTNPTTDLTLVYIVVGVVGGVVLLIILLVAAVLIVFSKSGVCGGKRRREAKQRRKRSQFVDFIYNESVNDPMDRGLMNNHNDNASVTTERSHGYSAYLRWNSPDPTYSTFQDSDNEARVIEDKLPIADDSSVVANRAALLEDYGDPIMERERMTELVSDKMDFHDLDDSDMVTFGFRNPEEMTIDLGEDLLSSIEHSLSHSTHNGNAIFPSALTNSQKSNHMLISDAEFTSFIYDDDMVDERTTARDENTIYTPSLSPDSLHL